MKLYLLTRTDDWDYDDYDDYDSFVVAAENEDNALEWHPHGGKREVDDNWDNWTKKENISIQCIGESNSKVEEVILLLSMQVNLFDFKLQYNK
jgi:hypothetical protein